MKKIIISYALLFVPFQAPWACEIDRMELQITNIENVQGALFIALHDSARTFLSKEEESSQSISVEVSHDGVQHISLCNVEAGSYAISVFHDENNNGELDSNFLGIPKEPYGFSNNLKKMLPPSFEEASFQFTPDDMIEIILK